MLQVPRYIGTYCYKQPESSSNRLQPKDDSRMYIQILLINSQRKYVRLDEKKYNNFEHDSFLKSMLQLLKYNFNKKEKVYNDLFCYVLDITAIVCTVQHCHWQRKMILKYTYFFLIHYIQYIHFTIFGRK